MGLICLAGLMSGLTLGLLSLDTLDLEVRAWASLNCHFASPACKIPAPLDSSMLYICQHSPSALQVLRRSGSEREKRHAQRIEPVGGSQSRLWS